MATEKNYKRKHDCVHYAACLTEKAIKSLPLQCSACRRYKANPLSIDDYVMINKEDVTIYKREIDETDYKYLSIA